MYYYSRLVCTKTIKEVQTRLILKFIQVRMHHIRDFGVTRLCRLAEHFQASFELIEGSGGRRNFQGGRKVLSSLLGLV